MQWFSEFALKVYTRIYRETLAMIIRAVDLIVIKKSGEVVFVVGGTNVFSGNIKAVHDYYYLERPLQTKLLAHSSSNIDLCEDTYKSEVKLTNSPAGLWCLIRSETIVVEYAPSDWVWPGLSPARHTFVNLWHGIPIKRIGLADDNVVVAGYVRSWRYFDYYIASSLVDKAMMSFAFGRAYSQVKLTGLPRNDWLLKNGVELSPRLRSKEEEVRKIINGRRLILYAPTFRGDHLSRDHGDNGVYSFSEDELKRLKEILLKHDAIFGIRPHLTKYSDDRIPYDDQLINMSRYVIQEVQMILRNTDILVSDYSSVWVDYLLMDRPVIGFAYDKDKYMADRGYLYDYDSIFPGPMVETFEEFVTVLETILGSSDKGYEDERRKFVKQLFHSHMDSNAAKRVYRFLTP